MLFDERDFLIFENDESRTYFKEIIQLYYNQNYRAAIVSLYSFVIYDLFIKIQFMADEGDKKAKTKLERINAMINDDEPYSLIEKEIIAFFKENCSFYFNQFDDDIDYLQKCRNKCAHLKVNDNSLFVPTDYQTKMLICSMYDHILSIKAPFIMDLFSYVEKEIENYSNSEKYSFYKPEDSLKNEINNRYLSRMTYDSLNKS